MRNWMLGAAVVAGGLGMGAAPAQAAEFGRYDRGPAAYIPPCPGPGYVWVAGYEAYGYWVPGRWQFNGVHDRGRFEQFDRGRDANRHIGHDHDHGQERYRR
jgi:hypothetical protein